MQRCSGCVAGALEMPRAGLAGWTANLTAMICRWSFIISMFLHGQPGEGLKNGIKPVEWDREYDELMCLLFFNNMYSHFVYASHTTTSVCLAVLRPISLPPFHHPRACVT